MTKLFKNILLVIVSLFLLSIITIFVVLWTFSNNIPDYKFLKNYKPPVSSKMYSGDGDLVADFSKEKRIFVPYEAIPKNVIYSFINQLEKILEYTKQLEKIDTEDIPCTTRAIEVLNVFRKDEKKNFDFTQELLELSPSREDDYFKEQKIIKE